MHAIKLTSVSHDQPVYVLVDKIAYIKAQDNGQASIGLISTDNLYVKESAEDILQAMGLRNGAWPAPEL